MKRATSVYCMGPLVVAWDMLPIAELLTIHITENSAEPRYRQLYHAFRESILAGRLRPGLKLPGSRAVARELGLSRNTVVAAFEQLEEEGFIQGVRGSGSYVSETLPDLSIRSSGSTQESASRDSGFQGEISARAKRLDVLHPRDRDLGSLPFTPGLPALDVVPLDRFARLMSRAVRDATAADLTYGGPMGYAPLREAVADYLRACRAVNCHAERILITNGAQQGLALISDLLLEQGSPVWIEEPGYEGARSAFRAAGARIVPVPVDEQGLNLEAGLALEPKPRLVYISPSHQYPTGVTMSLERRLRLLEWAQQNGVWLVEDDYDSELRYKGRPVAALQGLGHGQNVLYLGTFSKVLFPALRLGYMVIPDALKRIFTLGRSVVDTHPPNVTQMALAEFITEGSFASHLRRMRHLYSKRQSLAQELIESLCGSWLKINDQAGGMHLAAWAKRDFDDVQLAERGRERGLCLRPLSTYYSQPPGHPGLVLGFAGFHDYQLKEAAIKLAELFRALLSEH